MTTVDSLFAIVGSDPAARRFGVRLDTAHPILATHFPGHPIVPGACQISLVGRLATLLAGRALRLTSVASMKFVAPMSPDTAGEYEVEFTRWEETPDGIRAVGQIRCGRQPMTKFSLRYQ